MRRRSQRSQRGFTLVELSAVVVITTVLAMIAMFGFARHRGAARMTEATQLTTQIRDAQEAYKAETGVYADVSSGLTSYYPAASPGAFTTAWGDDCKVCSSLGAWRKLSVHPDAPVMYGYATIAGIGAVPTGGGSSSGGSSSGGSGAAGVPGPTDPFYVVQAKGDVNGDGVACTVMAASNNPALTVTNEGE